jgi:hypothetical protein
MVSRVSVNPGSEREGWSRPTARIDWLAGTIAECDGEGREAAHAWLVQPSRCNPDAGFRGYNDWHGDRNGSKVAREVQHHRRGVCAVLRTYLVLKGTGLMHLRSEGADDADILRRFIEWRGVCKRIDLAVDVRHPKVTPRALFDLYEARHFVTRLQEPALWGTPSGGQTFYLLGKGQTFRAYNKTAERARKGFTLPDGITRLEMELRGKWATRAFADLRQLLLSPDTWSSTFPKRAAEIVLSKARPLDGLRPERNTNRAPTWSPLSEALDGVVPVRIGRDERQRQLEEQLAGRLTHFQNNRKFLVLMKELLGPEQFAHAISQAELDPDDAQFLALLREDPARLRAFLVDSGVLNAPDAQADTTTEGNRAATN